MIAVMHGGFEVFDDMLKRSTKFFLFDFVRKNDTENITADAAETQGFIKEQNDPVRDFQQKLVCDIDTKTGSHVGKTYHIDKHQGDMLMFFRTLLYGIDKGIAVWNCRQTLM